ncbi:OX-2 membrane glycoprotein-like isoform X2 [Micropterus dolomieu]|uniref:OX-2 membrane glycoprotein-like isoform X2 n=1 Tax=Micropterus dolomieu TaxID=147949 RepID=UPI001E8D2894|nr:OX-2 membrane glycoprotein-like isoform X2 [Micropterus dolomieu]
MIHGAVIHLFCAFGVFQRGLTALIETQETVMAAVGGEARLNCLLMQPRDVLEVTWQKPLTEGEKTVATYNKHFGQKVNPDFRDKVEFEAAGLQNSSIVIRKVTEQDEGCYHCLFNSYPEGAHTGTTCLKLYELHEPVLHVGESNSAEEALVSCSATGRPAPTVTLSVLPHNGHFANHSSVGVTNTNGTVTVTTTAVLSRLHHNRTQVGCAVQVRSAPQIEVLVMIPEVKQSSAAGSDESDDCSRSWTSIILLSVVGTGGCVAAVILFWQHQSSLTHGDIEENECIKLQTETLRICHTETLDIKTQSIEGPNETREQKSNERQPKGIIFNPKKTLF